MARGFIGQKEKNLILFIEALKNCLKKDSFEKISVSGIVEAAGRSRQTFYRCCENKYDLVNKYLGMIILKSYKEMDKGMSLRDALTMKFRIMEPEKEFFSKTFKFNDYESLHKYTHRLIYAIYLDLYDSDKPGGMSREQKMLLDMYCEESIYATVKWSCHDLDYTPEDMAELLVDAMPEKLKKDFIYVDF